MRTVKMYVTRISKQYAEVDIEVEYGMTPEDIEDEGIRAAKDLKWNRIPEDECEYLAEEA
jgi:hypothetical protein